MRSSFRPFIISSKAAADKFTQTFKLKKTGDGTPALQFKRTKILASIGPASHDPKIIEQLIKAGANGVRLNFSHGTPEQHAQVIKWARKISRERKKPIAVVQDLQGPKIRIGDLVEKLTLKTGDQVKFGYKTNYDKDGIIPVQYDLSKKVQPGEVMYINDGRIRVRIDSISKGVILTIVEAGGALSSRKGINLPDTDLGGDIITKKDLEDLEFGTTQDIDYVALSFVQTAQDVELLREHLTRLKSPAKIIAKIETKAALENIDDIVRVSDGVMVARGDLAIEAGSEVVPIAQRRIVGLCMKYRKFVIVATQMLLSMVDSEQPTRAEVSDVATAVITGADCLMLSDETNNGQFPIEAVATMKRIILYAEANAPVEPLYMDTEDHTKESSIAAAALTLAHQIGAKAIVAETTTGRTARNVASHRPTMPIIMATDNKRVSQQLALIYGGKSLYFRSPHLAGSRAITFLRQHKNLAKGDYVVMTYGNQPGVAGGTNTIKVRVA